MISLKVQTVLCIPVVQHMDKHGRQLHVKFKVNFENIMSPVPSYTVEHYNYTFVCDMIH